MKTTSNLCPSLPNLVDHAFNLDTFLCGDGVVIECWLEVLVVSLTALFWCSRVESLCNSNPVEGTVSLNELHEVGIFRVGPRSSSVIDHCVDVC